MQIDVEKKKFRFDELLASFSHESRKKIEAELRSAMNISTRRFRQFRNAIQGDKINVGIDQLTQAALVFTKYHEKTITINDLING